MAQEMLWICTFIIPTWMARFDIFKKNILLVVVFFTAYSMLIIFLAKIYLGFYLFDGFFFDWLFSFFGCVVAFWVAKKIYR